METVIFLSVSFLMACFIENVSRTIHRFEEQNLLWLGLVSILLLASGVTLAYGGEEALSVLFSRTLTQVALCLLLNTCLAIAPLELG